MYNWLGLIHKKQGRFFKAIDFYEKAIERTSDEYYKAMISGNIANIYSETGDYAKAISYLEKSLIMLQNIEHKDKYQRIINNYHNQGHAFYKSGQMNLALEKNAFMMARYLTSNLYLTINKMPVSQLLASMDVFETHAGESNEHTVMFASFARAAGLPTRMVGGLIYLKGYFYYHTWPEVWLKQWVPVDPTMGQFPADVTHIRLMEGDIDKLASLGEIIGKIKIDIMSEIMGEL